MSYFEIHPNSTINVVSKGRYLTSSIFWGVHNVVDTCLPTFRDRLFVSYS